MANYLPVEKQEKMFQLLADGLTIRTTAKTLGISKNTVTRYLRELVNRPVEDLVLDIETSNPKAYACIEFCRMHWRILNGQKYWKYYQGSVGRVSRYVDNSS